jgi:putative protease
VAFFRSAEQIPEDLKGVSAVVLPVETDFGSLNLPKDVVVLADLPRGAMHYCEKYKECLKNAKQNGVKAAVVGNVAGITIVEEVGLPAVGGFGLNVFNSHSLGVLADLGLKAAICSFELTADGIKALKSGIPVGAISYSRLPLMIFKNCPGKNGAGCKNCGGKTVLTDRMQMEFPVMCRGEFSEMFNSKVVWNFDRIKDFGADFTVLYFTDEAKERCAEVINAATKGLSPDCDYTRGLYYRGVQ